MTACVYYRKMPPRLTVLRKDPDFRIMSLLPDYVAFNGCLDFSVPTAILIKLNAV
jgi:hypothetical protein